MNAWRCAISINVKGGKLDISVYKSYITAGCLYISFVIVSNMNELWTAAKSGSEPKKVVCLFYRLYQLIPSRSVLEGKREKRSDKLFRAFGELFAKRKSSFQLCCTTCKKCCEMFSCVFHLLHESKRKCHMAKVYETEGVRESARVGLVRRWANTLPWCQAMHAAVCALCAWGCTTVCLCLLPYRNLFYLTSRHVTNIARDIWRNAIKWQHMGS